MAKFMFIVPPLTGHVNPTLSVGAELLQSGHEVSWVSVDASLQERLPAGGRLFPITEPAAAGGREDAARYRDGISRKVVYGLESIKFLYEDVLVPLSRYMYPAVEKYLLDYRPDVVINDHQLFAGAIAAFRHGIPYATSITAPAAVKMMDDLPKIHEWEMAQVMGLQRELGIGSARAVVTSDKLSLVFTSKTLFGEMPLPPYYRLVGPASTNRSTAPSFDWDRFHSLQGPKVLVSIGTTFDHEFKKDFFAKVREAFGGSDLGVVVVSEAGLFDEWPGNFLVSRAVPQLELLPHLSGVICHAGHNTTCEALAHGLPLVVIPIAYDQSHVAGRVAATGCGIRLNFRRFKAAHLKNALTEILSAPSYRAAAQEIRESFRQAGGAREAANLLTTLWQNTSL